MLQRVTVFLVLTLIPTLSDLFAVCAQNPAYSFHVPKQWGKLTTEDAGCCPYLTYPVNSSSTLKRFPNFIGLGVQKSGSTTLAWYLSCHPDVAISRVKETHFMDKDYDNLTVRAYEAQWNGKRSIPNFRFEFTPNYIWIPFSACRVKETLPNMKFVVILRDPADRAYSEYNMVRRQCHNSKTHTCPWDTIDYLTMIEQGIETLHNRSCSFQDGKGSKTWNDCFGCLGYHELKRSSCQFRPYYFHRPHRIQECLEFSEEIVSRGLYAAQLAWWFSLFPPENFKVILSHDFYKDPVFYLNQIVDMVGIKKKYEIGMLPKGGKGIGMKGRYNDTDVHKQDAKELLTEFFDRPNLELYKLLNSVKQGPYTPFAAPSSTSMNSLHSNGTKQSSISINGALFLRSKSLTRTNAVSFPFPDLALYSLLSIIIAIVILWSIIITKNRSVLCK
eukprot:g1228.t1